MSQTETKEKLSREWVSAVERRENCRRIVKRELTAETRANPICEARRFTLIASGECLHTGKMSSPANKTNGAISNSSSESRSALSARPQIQFRRLNNKVDSAR